MSVGGVCSPPVSRAKLTSFLLPGIEKRYECANFGDQGITVGCWDTYRHDIDCQWIDITDLKPGDYIFQVRRRLQEEAGRSSIRQRVQPTSCLVDRHQSKLRSPGDGLLQQCPEVQVSLRRPPGLDVQLPQRYRLLPVMCQATTIRSC